MTKDRYKVYKVNFLQFFGKLESWQSKWENIPKKYYSCFVKEIHVKESDTLLLKIITIDKNTQDKCKQILGRSWH